MINVNKKIIATALSVVTVSMSALGMTVNASSKSVESTTEFKYCCVYDDYGLYESDELSALNILVQDTAKEIDMYVAIYISGTNMTDEQTEIFADQQYEAYFGENTDGVFYYMDLSGGIPAYDYISTSGRGALLYTDEANDGSDNTIDRMFDEIFVHMPSSGEEIVKSDIIDAVEEICYQLKYYGKKDVKSGYYHYDRYDDKYIYMKGGKAVTTAVKPLSLMLNFLFPAIVTGLVVGIVAFFIIKFRYRFKTGCDSSVYVDKDETRFHIKSDNFIRQYTTKTKIESSSGGGGGGGRSGGGSHGGGGRHR